jgi:hypothetical protein
MVSFRFAIFHFQIFSFFPFENKYAREVRVID